MFIENFLYESSYFFLFKIKYMLAENPSTIVSTSRINVILIIFIFSDVPFKEYPMDENNFLISEMKF